MHLDHLDHLTQHFNSFHICHDGEADDIQALVIANDTLQGTRVEVDCAIGSPHIVYAVGDGANEMDARMAFTNQLFQRNVANFGAMSNTHVSHRYVDKILEQSRDKECLVLHTASFTSL